MCGYGEGGRRGTGGASVNPKRRYWSRRPTPDAKTEEGTQKARKQSKAWRALARIADRAARAGRKVTQ